MSAARRLMLASASPRRRELLARLGHPFSVQPANVDEPPPAPGEDPAAYAFDLAQRKALAILAAQARAVVLAADTVVAQEGEVLGKPGSEREASETLRALRGKDHHAITAVAVAWDASVETSTVVSTVRMRPYRDEEIAAYIVSGDPFDKAGAYAIQNQAFNPVASLDGCYCNVVGLPLILTWRLLSRSPLMLPGLDRADLPPQCQTCPLRTG